MKWRIPLFTSDPETTSPEDVSFPEYFRVAIPRDAEHGKDIYGASWTNYCDSTLGEDDAEGDNEDDAEIGASENASDIMTVTRGVARGGDFR